VGKSTLLNRLLGQKISITSKKPQTTRNRILGVMHLDDGQFVFIDTPGIHKASLPLNTKIVETALTALNDVDLIVVLSDVTAEDDKSERIIISHLKRQHKPAILALNKIDLIKKTLLLSIIDRWQSIYPFTEIIPISARTGEQVETLIRLIHTLMPQGPPFFPPESITDLSERFIVAEMIREKALRLTGREVHYAIAVTISSFLERKKPAIVHIDAVIHVERESQKGIVIGKAGARLKMIGQAARKDIEKMLGVKVNLKLFVRVQKNWRKDTKSLRKFGYL